MDATFTRIAGTPAPQSDCVVCGWSGRRRQIEPPAMVEFCWVKGLECVAGMPSFPHACFTSTIGERGSGMSEALWRWMPIVLQYRGRHRQPMSIVPAINRRKVPCISSYGGYVCVRAPFDKVRKVVPDLVLQRSSRFKRFSEGIQSEKPPALPTTFSVPALSALFGIYLPWYNKPHFTLPRLSFVCDDLILCPQIVTNHQRAVSSSANI